MVDICFLVVQGVLPPPPLSGLTLTEVVRHLLFAASLGDRKYLLVVRPLEVPRGGGGSKEDFFRISLIFLSRVRPCSLGEGRIVKIVEM